jgi:glycerol dehydrogenase
MPDTRPDPDIRVFGSPHRYYQGPGALDRLPAICADIGRLPFLVVDADVRKLVESRLVELFAGRPHQIADFRGEVTVNLMDELAGRARAAGADLVVGMGGGKTLDVAKGCAIRIGARFVSVPTVASNDSPAASALAVYDEHHRMVAVESLGRNPEAVVVDTQLVAGAPAQFLLAGIGDAIAKKFEGEATARHGGVNAHGSYSLRTAGYIADGCYRTLRECAVEALATAGSGVSTPAFEAVVEANILMAGLGFENMGLGLAHGITRGLVRVPVVERAPHGFHVAYGTLVLLAAEERPDAFIDDMMQFFSQVGLPRSLTEMGLDEVDAAVIEDIAANTTVAPAGSKLLVPVGKAQLVAAIETIETKFRQSAGAHDHA